MPAQEDHANLLDVASRLFRDSAEDIEAFVSDGMKRLGYKPRVEWDDPEPEPGGGGGGGGGGDFFDRQRQRQRGGSGERRRVGGDRQPDPQRRASGGGFGGEYGS